MKTFIQRPVSDGQPSATEVGQERVIGRDALSSPAENLGCKRPVPAIFSQTLHANTPNRRAHR